MRFGGTIGPIDAEPAGAKADASRRASRYQMEFRDKSPLAFVSRLELWMR